MKQAKFNEAQIEGFTNELISAFLEYGKTGSDKSAITLYRLTKENPDQLIDLRKLPQLEKAQETGEYPFLSLPKQSKGFG